MFPTSRPPKPQRRPKRLHLATVGSSASGSAVEEFIIMNRTRGPSDQVRLSRYRLLLELATEEGGADDARSELEANAAAGIVGQGGHSAASKA